MLIDEIRRNEYFKARTSFSTMRTNVAKGYEAPAVHIGEAGVTLLVHGVNVWFAAPAFRRLWVKA